MPYEPVGPRDLEHLEDQVLFALVEITGTSTPLPAGTFVSEAELVRRVGSDRLADDSGIQSRGTLIECLTELERSGLVKNHKVMGPWSTRPTRRGRETVMEWQRLWTKNRDRGIRRRILEVLDAQRRERPNRHEVDGRIDVPSLIADLGISAENYLANMQRLKEQRKIVQSPVEEMALAEGWAHITEAGVAALEQASGSPSAQRGDAERAWSEVARLKKSMALVAQ